MRKLLLSVLLIGGGAVPAVGAQPPKVASGCSKAEFGRAVASLMCVQVAEGKYIWALVPPAVAAAASSGSTLAPLATARATKTTTAPELAGRVPLGKFRLLQDYSETYELRVDSVDFNAASKILQANSFNDPPKKGNVFVLVTMTYRYRGPESKVSVLSLLPLSLRLPNGNGVSTAFVVTPLDISGGMGDVFAGALVTIDQVFEVPASSVPSLVGYADDRSTTPSKVVFFSLR